MSTRLYFLPRAPLLLQKAPDLIGIILLTTLPGCDASMRALWAHACWALCSDSLHDTGKMEVAWPGLLEAPNNDNNAMVLNELVGEWFCRYLYLLVRAEL